MRIEDITKIKLKTAKDNELYSLKLRCIQVWQKIVGVKNAIKKRTFKKV